MAEDQHSRKKRRFTSNIINLKVGPAAECLTVHETFLQDNSPFFKAALEKQWKEGQTREIQLPHDSVQVVAAYIDYLYSKVVTVDRLQGGATDILLMVELYCFGEKILDDAFCDAVMSALICGIDQKDKSGAFVHPSGYSIKKIYEGTMVGSPLRRFAVDIRAQRNLRDNEEGMSLLPIEFMQDLIKEMYKIRSAPGPHGPLFPRLGTWLKAKK